MPPGGRIKPAPDSTRRTFLKRGARILLRREDNFAAIGIHQHFLVVINAL